MQAAAFQVAACIVFYVRTQSRIPAFYWLAIKLRPNALTTCLGLIHAGMFSIFCGQILLPTIWKTCPQKTEKTCGQSEKQESMCRPVPGIVAGHVA